MGNFPEWDRNGREGGGGESGEKERFLVADGRNPTQKGFPKPSSFPLAVTTSIFQLNYV